MKSGDAPSPAKQGTARPRGHEYTEQDFKAPAEIRKDNLTHADLRGARIEGVDFYLVDLRHALYDAPQERHLCRFGAILENRK